MLWCLSIPFYGDDRIKVPHGSAQLALLTFVLLGSEILATGIVASATVLSYFEHLFDSYGLLHA